MKTIAMITLSAASLLAAIPAFAKAKELDLACVAKSSAHRSGMIVREIIIGEDHTVTALADSQGRQVRAKKYAVVIEIIPGEGNEPAREEWEVLADGEFTLKNMGAQNYRVVDLRNRINYVCSINHEVHGNPALTRSN